MQNSLKLESLQQRIRLGFSIELEKMIEVFSCSKEPAAEKFLKTSALYYEQEGFSRIYLYITDETTPRIAAFFTVAITATSLEGIRTSRIAKKALSTLPPKAQLRSGISSGFSTNRGQCTNYTGYPPIILRKTA